MTPPPAPPSPRLLDRVRAALRIRRYIFFHDKRHPAEMGAAEISRFLSALAIQHNVAASTRNQAPSCGPGLGRGSRWC